MLFEDLKKENMLALKNKDAAARSILQIVINKAMLVKIDKREKGEELLDTDVITVINKTIKELDEEIAAFKTAGRDKQVEELTEQKKVIIKYLPRQLTEEEIRNEISKLEDKSIPSVMKHFKVNFAGKCDMRMVSKIAGEFK